MRAELIVATWKEREAFLKEHNVKSPEGPPRPDIIADL